jgi:hypothetical protein
MHHRHRVHELEQEVTRLRAHLDQVLEMPGRGEPAPAITKAVHEPEAAALPAPEADTQPQATPSDEIEATKPKKSSKRPRITLDIEPAAAESHIATNGAEKDAAVSAPQEV